MQLRLHSKDPLDSDMQVIAVKTTQKHYSSLKKLHYIHFVDNQQEKSFVIVCRSTERAYVTQTEVLKQ